jgi:flagellar assembly protein FliH
MARTILRKGGAAAGGFGAGGRAPQEPPVVPWQMNVIGETARGARAAEAPPPARPPEEELARIRQSARERGHAEGLAAGRQAAAREAAELIQLLDRLREVMEGFEQELSVSVLGLSVEVARQILRHTIQVHPEIVLPVIREAIASLPPGSQHPRLMLHPEDAALVRSVLDANQVAPAPWRIVEDAQLERGGCRIETATSAIDASVDSRWKAVVAALGREEKWVEMDPAARTSGRAAPRES